MSKTHADNCAAGYLLVTDKGVALYSTPTLRSGKVASRRLTVVSDPTGTIVTDDAGAAVSWTLNAFIVGVPLAAGSASGRVDLSHLGRVVLAMASAFSPLTRHCRWVRDGSSAGQSTRLIIEGAQVRTLPVPPAQRPRFAARHMDEVEQLEDAARVSLVLSQ